MSDRRMQSSRDDRRRDRDGDRENRPRSRSPHHRSGGGGARRGDYEMDSYSSSRGYREREREDRYGGGRRDGGRDWDRDRGSGRRDARRDEVDSRRRDNRRDLFEDRVSDRRRPPRDDDRRDGDRDWARDRDDMRQLDRQQRQKSASPVRKPREPTPDLTDITPVLQRKRRMTQWDIKPAGYDNISAEQAKLSGMFPLPGAPRQQPMDVSRLQAFMNQPGNSADQSALKPSSARQSKRLLIYNVPRSVTDKGVVEFFNLQLNGLNVTKGVDPCISAQVNSDQGYALVEFRSPEDTTTALAFDGISMGHEQANGHANGSAKGLEIKRPRDYIMPTAKDESMTDGSVLAGVPDTQSKICLTNIPIFLNDEQIKELLSAFGELRSFVMVKGPSPDENRGVAFCEYVDAEHATESAVSSLNGMELGDNLLSARRACVGVEQMAGEMSVNVMSMMAGTSAAEKASSRVICLFNMITPEDLKSSAEADEILEDIKEECEKFGTVIDIKMPRTVGPRANNGVGKIYVKFEDAAGAQSALENLAGRKFDNRTVVVSLFSEEYFDVEAW